MSVGSVQFSISIFGNAKKWMDGGNDLLNKQNIFYSGQKAKRKKKKMERNGDL
jgi:hypothetical protein